ncbi:MAG: DUF4190 domain-containing protein [Planctomycetes bacterium]|nr:DUF4190 domain-containing protein [Planctomycetota bacterium]
MDIEVECNSCESSMIVDDGMVGRMVACPICDAKHRVEEDDDRGLYLDQVRKKKQGSARSSGKIAATGKRDLASIARREDDSEPRVRRRSSGRRRYQGQGSVPGTVIAGFVLAFLCSPVGLILCIVGLGEARRNEAGEGLAIAGIAISGIKLLLIVVVFLMALMGGMR